MAKRKTSPARWAAAIICFLLVAWLVIPLSTYVGDKEVPVYEVYRLSLGIFITVCYAGVRLADVLISSDIRRHSVSPWTLAFTFIALIVMIMIVMTVSLLWGYLYFFHDLEDMLPVPGGDPASEGVVAQLAFMGGRLSCGS